MRLWMDLAVDVRVWVVWSYSKVGEDEVLKVVEGMLVEFG